MNRFPQWLLWTLAAVVALLVAGGVYLLSGHAAPDEEDAGGESAEVVVPVQTVAATEGTMPRTVAGYGVVVAAPGATAVVSVPFESQVQSVRVSPGESVAAGQPLVDLAPSPDAKLAFTDATAALAAAKQNLTNVQRRLKERLATNADEQAAQQALTQAQAKLDSLTAGGSGDVQKLTSPAAGVVANITAQAGQVAAAGTSLVEIVPADRVEAQLGVEPSDAAMLKPDQAVSVTAADGSAGDATGTVRLVTRRVDPATRLVLTFVALPPDSPLMLGGFVRGEVMVDRPSGIIVPRAAVLPTDSGDQLFTASDGKATAHAVRVILQTDTAALLAAGDVAAGDAVIIAGNYGLEDGAAVEATPTTNPATQPAEAVE